VRVVNHRENTDRWWVWQPTKAVTYASNFGEAFSSETQEEWEWQGGECEEHERSMRRGMRNMRGKGNMRRGRRNMRSEEHEEQGM